ncbi:uncharacterized protein LOC113391053 [Ctenocephalides felis]|uniref:uncharacterized protein LOC113391053 n=1 Tax=Ctenocephalides felis TaxID=7515 RepID=UPI000E6E412B|nr:uncharacterized protein LOC113391053 [Ctenocephalides felis]
MNLPTIVKVPNRRASFYSGYISTIANELIGNDLSTQDREAGMTRISTRRKSLSEALPKADDIILNRDIHDYNSIKKKIYSSESSNKRQLFNKEGSSKSSKQSEASNKNSLITCKSPIIILTKEPKIVPENSPASQASNINKTIPKALSESSNKRQSFNKEGSSKSSKESKASNNDIITTCKSPIVILTKEPKIVPENSLTNNNIEAATKNALEAKINLHQMKKDCDKIEPILSNINKSVPKALNVNANKHEMFNKEGGLSKSSKQSKSSNNDSLTTCKSPIVILTKEPKMEDQHRSSIEPSSMVKNILAITKKRVFETDHNNCESEFKRIKSKKYKSPKDSCKPNLTKNVKEKLMSIKITQDSDSDSDKPVLKRNMIDIEMSTQRKIMESKMYLTQKLMTISDTDDFDTSFETGLRIETDSEDEEILNSILLSGRKRNRKSKNVNVHKSIDFTPDENGTKLAVELDSNDMMTSDKVVKQNVNVDLIVNGVPEQDDNILSCDNDHVVIPNDSPNAGETFDNDFTDSEPEIVDEVNLNSPGEVDGIQIISKEILPKEPMSSNFLDTSMEIVNSFTQDIEEDNISENLVLQIETDSENEQCSTSRPRRPSSLLGNFMTMIDTDSDRSLPIAGSDLEDGPVGSCSMNLNSCPLDMRPAKESDSHNHLETINLNDNVQIDFCANDSLIEEAQINLVNNEMFNIDPKYASMIKPCSVVLEDCLEPVHIEPEIDINIETTVHACIPCNETYTTLKDLRKHVYTTHVSDTTNKCFICDVEITNKNKMTTHILTHMLTVIYICEICNAVTETQESYDKHMLTQHNSFVCDVCGKPCSSKNTLTKHKIVHQPDRYKCKVCSKIFGSARKLRRHMLIHGERKFFCEICDATFCRREVLNDHVKMHSTERAYKCDFCSKTFTTKSSLYAHIRIHDKTKQKKCEYCSKTFTTRQALLRHLYKHENVQLHQCNVCKNVYETLSELKAHEQKHNGDLETFQCRICGEVFTSKVKLSHHREGCRDKNDSNEEVGSHWLM